MMQLKSSATIGSGLVIGTLVIRKTTRVNGHLPVCLNTIKNIDETQK